MTFKHKLSRRLALLRNVLLVGLGVAAACDLQQLVGLLQSVVVTVTVSPAAPSVAVGGTLLLTATPKDANGNPLTGRTVTWASSAPAVATVSSTGLVTGMAAGAATITATCEKMSGAAAATVAAPAPLPVASVSVSPAAPSLTVGATVQLAATPLDASGTPLSGRVVTWATSSAAVATVSGSGLVTGVAAGTATITATSEGKSGTAAATVSTVPVATVTVNPATASIALGATTQLTATPKDASGNPLSGRVVTWATSSAAVATVSGSGLVTGVAAGTATITATSEGQSGTAAITSTATNPGTVTDLAVTGVTDSSVSLTFTEVTNGAGQPASYDIRWAVGTISWGSATSVARGTCATPVAGSAIGAKRSCTVLGLVAATGYQFQVIAFRGTLFVNAVFGLLSNVVSATTAASTAPVATVTVSPASASLAVGATQQFTATLKDAAGNTLTGRPVTWASSAAAVATVSASGLATGLVAGPATISASSGGITGSATLTVTAASGGGTVLIQENFEDNAFASRGWYDNTGMTITDTTHLAGSTHALEAHFPRGSTTPTWGNVARHLFTATPTLYISYWVRYSDNWVGSGQPYHPHEFLVLSDLDGDFDGPSNNWLTLYVEHNYQNGGIPRLALQDNKAINTSFGTPPINLIGVTENRSTGGCNGVVETNVVATCYNAPPWYNGKELHAAQVSFQPTPGTGYKGNWNHVEVYFQINSIVAGVGQADGVMQYWFNGTLVIDRHDILFRTGARATVKFHQFLIGPYIGDGSPVDQYMWIDNLTVATAKP